MLAQVRRFYMLIGRGVGGVLGVLAFLATWIFCIARFGLVFGIALGWIPGAIVGMVLSFVVSWLWLPLVLLAVFVISAPSWDKRHVVEKAMARATVYAVRGWAATEATIKRAANWTREEAQREGLTKKP